MRTRVIIIISDKCTCNLILMACIFTSLFIWIFFCGSDSAQSLFMYNLLISRILSCFPMLVVSIIYYMYNDFEESNQHSARNFVIIYKYLKKKLKWEKYWFCAKKFFNKFDSFKSWKLVIIFKNVFFNL